MLSELYDGLCSICKMEKEVKESRVMKNPESIVKDALRKIAGKKKEASTIVKEGGEK